MSTGILGIPYFCTNYWVVSVEACSMATVLELEDGEEEEGRKREG